MNERIRELAEQANANELSYAYYRGEKRPENAVTLHSVDLEKFAELIVLECMDIAYEVRGEPATDTHYVIGYDRACEKMIDGIKEHFGVEE